MKNIFAVLFVCILFLSILERANSVCSSTDKRAREDITVTQEPVYLTSPGWKISYYSNMDCQWTLTATGEKVIIDVMESYFEGSPGCSYDYLGLYDGANVYAEATKLCNNLRFGQLFVSTGEKAVIRLKSDFSVHYPGFQLRYFIGKDHSGGCNIATALTATTALQYLSSPLFPDPYDKSQTCSWIISSSSKSIRIELLLLDMLDGEVCYSDHLYIYEGADDTGTLIADVCDSSATFTEPVVYNTTGTSAFIKFVTRLHGRSRRGFLLSYNETDTVVTSSSDTASNVVTYSTCGTSAVTASSTPIYVTTPDYPIFYSVNLNCRWSITGPSGSILNIKVIDFYLEDSEECMSDNVIIYDGSSTSYPQLSKSCGEVAIDVNTTGNTALISFTSDGSSTARGFKYEITSLDGGTPGCVTGSPTNLNATTDRQYIQSANYPSNYDSSTSAQWLIYNSISSDYEIVIETIDSRIENSVDCVADKVQLYQGPCTSYPSLGSFCGVSQPTYVQSNGLYVLMAFTTDTTSEYRGFNISYYLRKVTTNYLSTKQIVGIIVGVVAGVVALSFIAFILYKKVLAKKIKSWKRSKMHGSRSSLGSHSSSSSSSSSDSERYKPQSKRVRLTPIKTQLRNLPSTRYALKSRLPPIKGK